MAGDREIQDVIQVIAGTRGKDELYLFVGEVTKVDKDKRTCDVQAHSGKHSALITDVKLMAAVDDGLLLVPENNSTVLVIGSKYAGFYAIQTSGIDEIIMRGGDLKGLVVLDKLVTRLNKIEDDINNLKTAITGWTPVPNDGGAALKAASSTWASQRLVDTQASDIENDKIKQG